MIYLINLIESFKYFIWLMNYKMKIINIFIFYIFIK